LHLVFIPNFFFPDSRHLDLYWKCYFRKKKTHFKILFLFLFRFLTKDL